MITTVRKKDGPESYVSRLWRIGCLNILFKPVSRNGECP
jgi:hypothetical protein